MQKRNFLANPNNFGTTFPVSGVYVFLCLFEVIKVIHFEIVLGYMDR